MTSRPGTGRVHHRKCVLGSALLLLSLFSPQLRAQSTLDWNGNISSLWDQNLTANWLVGGVSTVFTNGAAVFFGDAAQGSGSVTLAGPLQTASVTISNQAKSYTLNGPGHVSGSTTWTKLGQAQMTVAPTTRFISSGTFSIGAGKVLLDGASVQTNQISGELWVGSRVDNPAELVLSNTTVNVSSWFAVGRGNGTSGHASSATLFDSVLTCNNASLGYWANVAGNLQNPSLTMNGASRVIVGGGTGFNLGESGGSSATVTVQGSSVLTTSERLLLGIAGGSTGNVVIANSGTLTNGSYASVGVSGVGSATLKDSGIWHCAGDFNLADLGGSQGTVYVQNNALLRVGNLFVGKAANSTGIVHQTGGTVVRTGSDDSFRIGGNANGGVNQLGVYNLFGGTLSTPGNFQVGVFGEGRFNQTGGTASVGAWPSVARFPGSIGMMTVSAGTFNQTGSGNSLIIGEEGSGTLTVSGSGLINLANSLRIGNASGATGVVNLNGGTIVTRRVYTGHAGASSTFNFNGGILRAGHAALADFFSGLTAANIQNGGAKIDTGTNRITIAQDLPGTGALTKSGAGALTLSGNLSYGGPTIVDEGTLLVVAPNALSSPACSVASGAVFGVKLGSPDAQVTVGNLSLANAGSKLRFDFGGLGSQAVAPLSVSGFLTVGGVTAIDVAGANFTTGQFPLLHYAARSGPGGFVLGALPFGMEAHLVTNTPNQSIDLAITVAPTTLPWQLKQAPLMTDWAQQVDPANPWPEYPRPQMQRTSWLNLNGVWQWQPGSAGDSVPGQNLTGTILVPFCMESAISGVMEHHERAWYKRTFEVPSNWTGQRILLHFEAVDWECEAFINGVSVGVHQGGYDPFSFDITPFLTNSGPHELIVRVYDPTDATSGPVLPPTGKQHLNPGGIWYTPCSGIWQSVWLEPVPSNSIADIHLVPDIDNQKLDISVTVSGSTAGLGIRAVAFDGGSQVGTASGVPGAQFSLSIPSPKLWCPTNPFLYDLRLDLTNSGGVVDSVASYFGMRKISLGTNNGFVKLFLNNEFMFQFGPLDQGFWPDGIYTPPTDQAMRVDIEQSKALGFNMIRKHVKVEPRRWYYYTDLLGLVVWQDMPSMVAGVPISNASKTNFDRELTRMIESFWNHPSIIIWTVFNEGWGQHDTVEVTSKVMDLDPSRLVNCASGWTYYDVGHMEDSHSYPNPSCPQNDTRAVVNGEFGGVGLGITNHTWASGWGYIGASDGDDLTLKLEGFCNQLSGLVHDRGLSAAVYTQITDVETELNGLYTYDRKVLKPDLRRMQQAIVSTMGLYANTPVVPNSRNSAQTWKYTFSAPAANWVATGFNDSAWSSGPGGFGTAGTPGAVIGTVWNTADIWLRRTFDSTSFTPQQISNLVFSVHHDENVGIYLNGVLAASASGYTTAYGTLPMSQAAKDAIVAGAGNVLAVHCHQTGGGQYIDVGIDVRTVVIPPPPPPPAPDWDENGTGLVGEYFSGTDLLNRQFLRTDATVNFDWTGLSPGPGVGMQNYSVRWSTRLQPRYSETYTFHVTANDGCRLWVDNQLLVDKWYNDAGTDKTGTILLTGGERYDLRLEYYQNTGNAAVKLEWTSASQLRELIPQGVMFPNRAPVLNAVPNQTITAGQTLSILASASDPDAPPQVLSFSLANAPVGAVINPQSGLVTWRPTVSQGGTTYPLTVKVSDDGAPILDAVQSFSVTVLTPASPVLTALGSFGDQFQVAVNGPTGPDYSVYAKSDLGQAGWTHVLRTNSPVMPFTFTEPITNSQRFYRIQLGP